MNVVDLFCGCGGMSLGFSKAGYNIMAGLDNWEKALDTYRQNFRHPAINTDLKDVMAAVDLIYSFHPDIIIGGPPCQDFSSAGKRDENNGRGDLTISYANIVASASPEWFVMENVARIVKTQKLEIAKSILKKAGYGMTQYILDASLCGVPQTRKRFFLIGKKLAPDGFLLPFLEKNLASKPMTVADYFGKSIGISHYYRHPRSYARRGIFSINEPSPTIRGVNRPMPQGYKLHSGDPVESLEGIRELTTEERSRIQTFPASFIFSGNKTEKEQMIGNAVPVNLAYYVGKAILEYLIYTNRPKSVLLQDDKDYWMHPSTQMTLFEKGNDYIFKGMAYYHCPDECIEWTTENMMFCIKDSTTFYQDGIKAIALYDDACRIIGCYEAVGQRRKDRDYLKQMKYPSVKGKSDKFNVIVLKPLTDYKF